MSSGLENDNGAKPEALSSKANDVVDVTKSARASTRGKSCFRTVAAGWRVKTMLKRVCCVLLLLGVLVSLPVKALDYHHSRTDGEYIVGTSVGQQSSNQAFNI